MSREGQSAVVIRMPTTLRDAVRAKAAGDHRSMANAIRYALSLYVRDLYEGDNT